jgi:hypothetical protein
MNRSVRSRRFAAPAAAAAALAIAGILAPVSTFGADEGCAKVHKALENVVTTPAHVYSTETSSLRGTTQTETIYLDGKVYVLVNGRWTLNPVSSVEMAKQQRQSRKSDPMACRLVGEERVGDRSTKVYATSRRTGDSEVHGRLWIDEVSGLLLKQEDDMTGEKDNTVHRSYRFEYGNVSAPKIDSP